MPEKPISRLLPELFRKSIPERVSSGADLRSTKGICKAIMDSVEYYDWISTVINVRVNKIFSKFVDTFDGEKLAEEIERELGLLANAPERKFEKFLEELVEKVEKFFDRSVEIVLEMKRENSAFYRDVWDRVEGVDVDFDNVFRELEQRTKNNKRSLDYYISSYAKGNPNVSSGILESGMLAVVAMAAATRWYANASKLAIPYLNRDFVTRCRKEASKVCPDDLKSAVDGYLLSSGGKDDTERRRELIETISIFCYAMRHHIGSRIRTLMRTLRDYSDIYRDMIYKTTKL